VSEAAEPVEYVLARTVLLDALEALGPHRPAVVLVGAQAVYLHTGASELAVAPTTTDADLALEPGRLADEPRLGDALRAAGFLPGANPGSWLGTSGVAVDLMVPEALSGSAGRRGARLPGHGKDVARRTTGLEPAIVDNEVRDLMALDPADGRAYPIRVAGPAALIVAKIIKIEERRGQPGRVRPKDALDLLRLLQGTDAEPIASRLVEFTRDRLAGVVTQVAIGVLREHGLDPAGQLASLAVRAVGALTDPAVVAASLSSLVDEVLTAYDELVGDR